MSKVFSFEVPEFSNVFFESFFEVFGKSNSAKKCKKGGPFAIVWASILLQNREKLKGVSRATPGRGCDICYVLGRGRGRGYCKYH